MKRPTQKQKPLAQIDPSSFVGDPALIRMLDGHAVPTPCTEDGALFRQGDPPVGLYIFHQGIVNLSMMSKNGQSLFAVQALPGSVLGLPALISNQPYSLTATARAGAQVTFVSRDDFTRLMMSSRELSAKILEILAAEVRSARRALR
jgi:CRP/FNR family transcriptional regulator, cyclic AMP receptor protein